MMMVEITNPLRFDHRDQWRGWLETNHASTTEAWLIIFKKKYQEEGLSLNEAVEEALCFGWIDGTLKSLDQKRYALRFSPRSPQSTWSISNIKRVENLIAAGKMTQAGAQKVAEAKKAGEWQAAIQREQVDIIPIDLEKFLRRHKGALSAYRQLPNSRKKQYIYWLQKAKRADTRQKRMQKILDEILA